MKVEAFKCDSCSTIMQNKEAGFEFRGNVAYLDGGGLIGNNLDGDKVIKLVHYCTSCTIRILGLQHKATIRQSGELL